MSYIDLVYNDIRFTSRLSGCDDSCHDKPDGVSYPSYCGPSARYYDCEGDHINYHYCGNHHHCLLGGACGEYYKNSYCGNERPYFAEPKNTNNFKKYAYTYTTVCIKRYNDNPEITRLIKDL